VKVALKPGAELDVLTRAELRDELEAIVGRLRGAPATVRAEADGQTTAAGAITEEVYKVPLGMSFKLTRLAVLADGFTPAVPFQGAGAFLELLRNDVPVAWCSLVAGAAIAPGALPMQLIDADSPDSAAWYANGDCVAVRITAGPASTRILVRAQGTLEPVVIGN
jgi:hypothetical protein